jgi:uncharacterized protein YdeI (YjbR/CyaY-like superfamily)
LKTVTLETAAEWRRWLAAHHGSEKEIWLVFHKRHTGRKSIEYDDSVDQALCYGWIDSLIKRIDDDRYARKFTPRKTDSVWSDSNRRRYAALRRDGRLAASGRARAPTDRRPDLRTGIRLDYRYVRAALEKNKAAAKNFARLAPSEQRKIVGWIILAKRADTKQRRLKELISVLAAGKKLGLK